MRTLLLFCCCLFALPAFSQRFYEATWENYGIEYTAFIEFFDKNDIKVRVKFRTFTDVDKIIKYTCKGEYSTDAKGNRHFLMKGQDAETVYSSAPNKMSHKADNFLFKNIQKDGISDELYVYDELDAELGELPKAELRELDLLFDLDEDYLIQFFTKDEPEYKRYTTLFDIDDVVVNNDDDDFNLDDIDLNLDDVIVEEPKRYHLKFRNDCVLPVQAAFRYMDVNNQWQTKGLMTVESGKTITIADSPHDVFYYYARNSDEGLIWGGDKIYSVGGQSIRFRETHKSGTSDDWQVYIACSDYKPKPNPIPNPTPNPNPTPTPTPVADNVRLHVILAADTKDANIGTSTRKDLLSVGGLLEQVVKELGMKVNLRVFEGDALSRSNLLSAVQSLLVGSNDVVLFYYSGHGYNENKGGKFPNMALPGDDLGLEALFNQLKAKGARLTLTMGDLCNSIPQTRSATPAEEEIIFKSGYVFDRNKLYTLFVKSKGALISTSSQAGEWSYCSSNTDGTLGNGHFTKAFINSFTKETSKVSSSTGSWTNIFTKAYSEVQNNTQYFQNQSGGYGQHGFYSGSVSY